MVFVAVLVGILSVGIRIFFTHKDYQKVLKEQAYQFRTQNPLADYISESEVSDPITEDAEYEVVEQKKICNEAETQTS